jgi:hypothetical protein
MEEAHMTTLVYEKKKVMIQQSKQTVERMKSREMILRKKPESQQVHAV